MKMKFLITLIVGAIFIFVLSVDVFAFPTIVDHDITNLNLIESISKFRSGAGHDYSYSSSAETDPTETDRSMKHYFQPYLADIGTNSTIPIFAPFSGVIISVSTEQHILLNGEHGGKQVWVVPNGYGFGDPDTYTVGLFHVNLDDRFPQSLNSNAGEPNDTTYVTKNIIAGELLGYADLRPDGRNFDIAVSHILSPSETHLISYFDIMPDSLFANYQARGVSDRDELIISKEYRDANPVGAQWGQYNPDDWVVLNSPSNSVPEPATMLLFGLGGVGMAFIRGKRKA